MVKYYAVVTGIKPGMYTDWPTTQRMTNGYPGAIFKSFSSRTEAEKFLNKSIKGRDSTIYYTSSVPNKTIIYTDGSYSKGVCGYGIVILTSNGDKITIHGRVPLPLTSNVAELYAIYVALCHVRTDVILYSDSFDCIKSISYNHDWMRNGWIANKDLLEAIHAQTENRSVSFHHIPIHNNLVSNKEAAVLNEEANHLANQGRLSSQSCIVSINGVHQSNLSQ